MDTFETTCNFIYFLLRLVVLRVVVVVERLGLGPGFLTTRRRTAPPSLNGIRLASGPAIFPSSPPKKPIDDL